MLTMDLVMLPAQTLSDAYTPPLLLREQAKSAAVIGIEEILGDHLEKRLGEDDVLNSRNQGHQRYVSQLQRRTCIVRILSP